MNELLLYLFGGLQPVKGEILLPIIITETPVGADDTIDVHTPVAISIPDVLLQVIPAEHWSIQLV